MKLKHCIISVALAMLPPLSIYEFLPGVNLGTALLLACVLLAYDHLWQTLSVARDEITLFLGVLILSVFGAAFQHDEVWFDYTLFQHNILAVVLFFTLLILLSRKCHVVWFSNTVLLIGIVASILCLYQFSILMLVGEIVPSLYIPGLEVIRDLDSLTTIRPSSIFTEPAHLCIYLLPAFNIALLRSKYIFATLFGVSILASGSTTGFLILAVLILINFMRGKKISDNLILIFCVIIVVFVILEYFPLIFEQNLNKLGETESSNERLLGPIVNLRHFSFENHLLGISLNQFSGFVSSFGVGQFENNYANALLYMYVSFGVLGECLLWWYLYRLYKYRKVDFGFMAILLGVLASDQVLFNSNLLYLLTCCILSKRMCGYFNYDKKHSRFKKVI